jgi:hypothetical protein
VEEIELLDKKGFLTISISVPREGKIFLRKPEGLREWHDAIRECVIKSKERRVVMKSTKDFWSKKQFTDSSSMEQWILARQRIADSETESCVSGNGLWSKSKSNVNLARRNPVTTYDYGFIDLPTALSPRLPRPDYMAKRPGNCQTLTFRSRSLCLSQQMLANSRGFLPRQSWPIDFTPNSAEIKAGRKRIRFLLAAALSLYVLLPTWLAFYSQPLVLCTTATTTTRWTRCGPRCRPWARTPTGSRRGTTSS